MSRSRETVKSAGNQKSKVSSKHSTTVTDNELLKLYHELSTKELAFRKRKDRVKQLIKARMGDQEFLNTKQFVVKKRSQSRHIVSQSDLPSEIWDKYKRKITYHVIRVTPTFDEEESF